MGFFADEASEYELDAWERRISGEEEELADPDDGDYLPPSAYDDLAFGYEQHGQYRMTPERLQHQAPVKERSKG